MSPRLEARIDAALGFPAFDPHGDPIPDADLNLPEIKEIPLSRMTEGEQGRLRRVPHEDPEVLRYLGSSGLRPGVRIRLLTRTPYDQTLRIKLLDTQEEVVIGPNLSGLITLTPET